MLGDRGHACCATAVLGLLARGTANHRRENYLQTQHSTRPALEQPPVEATSLETQPAALRRALRSQGPWPARHLPGDRRHACFASALLRLLARVTANHRRENYL